MFKNGMMWDLDAYKIGHMTQYPEDTEYIYSVLQLRYSYDHIDEVVMIGLQYFIKEYLTKPFTQEGVDEFLLELKRMGVYHESLDKKLQSLVDLGYLPIEIKAIPEGTILQVPNAICTVTNTLPGYHWVVGLIETLLLKIWAPILTASKSLKYRKLVTKYMNKTSDNNTDDVIDFMIHDFGSRGCSCPEHAALTGMAHALVFRGSDTIATIPLIKEYYGLGQSVSLINSIPATEHSVMCSYGVEHELDAFKAMLDKYPTGLLSIVSDTYDWYNVMDKYTVELHDVIMERDGKVVFRPDSGNPIDIIVGTIKEYIPYEEYDKYNAKELGGIRALAKVFGTTVNSKGYRVLNPKVGLIYGDGMYLERYEETLKLLEKIGYSVENLVIGVGGILRDGSRDSVGAAFKATWIKRRGMDAYSIMKNPITDTKKKSFKGRVKVVEAMKPGHFTTFVETSIHYNYAIDALKVVYRNGEMIQDNTWDKIEETFENSLYSKYKLYSEEISEYRDKVFVIEDYSDFPTTSKFEPDKWGAGEYKFPYITTRNINEKIVIFVPYLTFKSLEKLLVLKKYLEKSGVTIDKIKIGYFSYSRQERETTNEPELLSTLNNCLLSNVDSSKVEIVDIHNRESMESYGYTLSTALPSILDIIKEDYKDENIILVAPDKGALQRNKEIGLSLPTSIHFNKTRKDGKVISEMIIDKIISMDDDKTFVILDDMCDGGRTFANAASQLKKDYPNSKVILGITHAILPYGVDTLVRGGVDKIYTTNTCMKDIHCGDYIKVIQY